MQADSDNRPSGLLASARSALSNFGARISKFTGRKPAPHSSSHDDLASVYEDVEAGADDDVAGILEAGDHLEPRLTVAEYGSDNDEPTAVEGDEEVVSALQSDIDQLGVATADLAAELQEPTQEIEATEGEGEESADAPEEEQEEVPEEELGDVEEGDVEEELADAADEQPVSSLPPPEPQPAPTRYSASRPVVPFAKPRQLIPDSSLQFDSLDDDQKKDKARTSQPPAVKRSAGSFFRGLFTRTPTAPAPASAPAPEITDEDATTAADDSASLSTAGGKPSLGVRKQSSTAEDEKSQAESATDEDSVAETKTVAPVASRSRFATGRRVPVERELLVRAKPAPGDSKSGDQKRTGIDWRLSSDDRSDERSFYSNNGTERGTYVGFFFNHDVEKNIAKAKKRHADAARGVARVNDESTTDERHSAMSSGVK